jgi:hypothetical protein
MHKKGRIARRAHNSHPVTRERRPSRILATASKEKGNVLHCRGAGFLKREVLKPAIGEDQTKFFAKEIQLVGVTRG